MFFFIYLPFSFDKINQGILYIKKEKNSKEEIVIVKHFTYMQQASLSTRLLISYRYLDRLIIFGEKNQKLRLLTQFSYLFWPEQCSDFRLYHKKKEVMILTPRTPLRG